MGTVRVGSRTSSPAVATVSSPINEKNTRPAPAATPESLAALNAKLGLDRPPLARYGAWVGGLLQDDVFVHGLLHGSGLRLGWPI